MSILPNVNLMLPTTIYGNFQNQDLGFPGLVAQPASAYFKGSLAVDGQSNFDGNVNFNYALPMCSQIPLSSNQLVNKAYVDANTGSGISILPLANTFTNTNTFTSGAGSVYISNGGITTERSINIQSNQYLRFITNSGANISSVQYQMTFRDGACLLMSYFTGNKGSSHIFSASDLNGNVVDMVQMAYNQLSIHTSTTFDVLPSVAGQPLATRAYADSLVLTGPTGPAGANGTNGLQGIQGIPGSNGSNGLQGDQGIPGIQGDQGIQGIQGNDGAIGPVGPAGGGDVTLAGDNTFTGLNTFQSQKTLVNSLQCTEPHDNIGLYGIQGAFPFRNLTTGSSNVSIGSQAGYSFTSGSGNVCIGNSTGNALTTGNFNLLFGANAGNQLSTEHSNTYAGTRAGLYASGNFNIGFGDGCCLAVQSDNNICFGQLALQGAAYGGNNICFGYNSGANGQSLQYSTNNVFIGVNTGYGWGLFNTPFSNSVCIGANSYIDNNNQIRLGTSSETVSILGSLEYNVKYDINQGNSNDLMTLDQTYAYKTILCNPTGAKIILLPDPSIMSSGSWITINNFSTNISGIIQIKDFNNSIIYATLNPTTSNNIAGNSIKLMTNQTSYFSII